MMQHSRISKSDVLLFWSGSMPLRLNSSVISLCGGAVLYLSSAAYVAANPDGLGFNMALVPFLLTVFAYSVTGFFAVGGNAARLAGAWKTMVVCGLVSGMIAVSASAAATLIALSFPLQMSWQIAISIGMATALASVAGCLVMMLQSRKSYR